MELQVRAASVAILFTVYCSSFNSFSGSQLQLRLQRMALLDMGLQRVPRFGLDLNENVKISRNASRCAARAVLDRHGSKRSNQRGASRAHMPTLESDSVGQVLAPIVRKDACQYAPIPPPPSSVE